jgi:hypothetical protein
MSRAITTNRERLAGRLPLWVRDTLAKEFQMNVELEVRCAACGQNDQPDHGDDVRGMWRTCRPLTGPDAASEPVDLPRPSLVPPVSDQVPIGKETRV